MATNPDPATHLPARHEPGRRSVVRVLAVAAIGALLIGFAGFAVSTALTPDAPVPQTMCLDSSCTYAMSAGGGPAPQPAHHARSAPERFVRKVLYFCHIH